MDEHLETPTDTSTSASAQPLEDASAKYLGRWHRLVSTTNWEKGRIILQWRRELAESGAAASLYSDEAWSQQVGGVTPQHVGRLRRVCERFSEARDKYPGLFWSHFQAALDWDDAEMWLEGARQNAWSVARMRQERFDTLGALADAQPQPEGDEDTDEDAAASEDSPPEALSASVAEVQSLDEGGGGADDVEDAPDAPSAVDGVPFDSPEPIATASASEAPAAPFAGLPEMPDDLADAFEAFKVSIVRHKASGWQEVSRDEVVRVLEALRNFALAPPEGD